MISFVKGIVDYIDENACLSISVDTEYAVWLNGTLLGCCQYDDYPDNKVFDNYEVSKLLHPGKNVLIIKAYYQGIESFQYSIGAPGLWFCLTNGTSCIASDETVYCRKNAQYTCGEIYKITLQLGFGFMYDASKKDFPWKNAVELPSHTTLSPRPIKRTVLSKPTVGKLISQGYYIRKKTSGTFAEQMNEDFLSFRRNFGTVLPFGNTDYPYIAKDTEADGVYLLFDWYV